MHTQQKLSNELTTETENSVLDFVEQFGAASNYTEERTSISKDRVEDVTSGELDLTQGALINPTNTIGIYWDWEKYDPPYHDIADILTAPTERISKYEYEGGVHRLFERGDNSTLITLEYLEGIENVWHVDVTTTYENVTVHPEQDQFPIRIDSPKDNDDSFILIAPRIKHD